MDFAIVDLQGFKDNSNNFVLKEFSILTKNIKFSDIIKPTFAFSNLNESSRKAVCWLSNYYHGFDWNDGYIDFDELQKTIKPILQNKLIYVKGDDKICWLKKILDDECGTNVWYAMF